MVVGELAHERELIIIGGGPGGYQAAIRAAQLGQSVTLIERAELGGVCLMNMISGVMTPDVGTVSIDSQNVTPISEYKRANLIGRVFQDPMAGTAPSMTIEVMLHACHHSLQVFL